MEAQVTVHRLGVHGLVGLAGDAIGIIRASGVWIAFGVIATMGVDKLAPSSIEGLVLEMFSVVVLAGAFAWMQRWQQAAARAFPVARLLWLGVAVMLLMLPLVGLMAATQMLVGMIFLGLTSYVQMHAGPIVSTWFTVLIGSLPALVFMLAFCLAPVLVTTGGVRPGAAIGASVKAWVRNPAAFAIFLMVGVMVFAVRAVPLWAVLGSVSVASMIQPVAVALCASAAVALLVAFHVRVFDVQQDGDPE